jgi:hypothetical protein
MWFSVPHRCLFFLSFALELITRFLACLANHVTGFNDRIMFDTAFGALKLRCRAYCAVNAEQIMEVILKQLLFFLNSSLLAQPRTSPAPSWEPISQIAPSVFILLGIFFILLGILAVAFLAVYHLGKWKGRSFAYDKRLDKIEAFYDSVIELQTKVQMIYDNTNPRKLAASSRPIALTELGRGVASTVNAATLFNKYSAALVGKVNARCPASATAHDMQVVAFDVGKKALPGMATADEINAVKNEAYKQGILDEDIWSIFGLYLRDHLLQSRGIPVINVAGHAPAAKSKTAE